MFFSLVKTRIKVLSRQYSMLFWTLLFPIVLATFFFLAFSNLTSSETLKTFQVGLLKTEDQAFTAYINAFGIEEHALFQIHELTEEEAKEKLQANEIVGYFASDKTMVVKKNGIEQTIMNYVIDRYHQTNSLISSLGETHPEALAAGVLEELKKEPNYLVEKTSQNTDVTVIYFYTLIGMVCMYAGFFGIDAVCESEANLSTRGARLNISPTHKLKSLMASLLGGWMFQFVELLLLLAYLVLVLDIDFGNQLGYVLLIMVVGSFAGITTGTFFGAISRKSKDHKISFFVTLCLFLSFLSGMMVVDIKYWIQETVPFLSKINPVSLITDGLYSLYYYTTQTRFWSNILFLLLFSGGMMFLSYFTIRRKKYDSI